MKGKILILDDDPSILRMLSAMLKILEFETKLTTNATDFMQEFHQSISNGNLYAALILDLTIPDGKGGRELINEIRKIDQKTPAFVTTGHSGDPIVIQPKKYGFTGAIIKPFSIGELGSKLKDFL